MHSRLWAQPDHVVAQKRRCCKKNKNKSQALDHIRLRRKTKAMLFPSVCIFLTPVNTSYWYKKQFENSRCKQEKYKNNCNKEKQIPADLLDTRAHVLYRSCGMVNGIYIKFIYMYTCINCIYSAPVHART